MAAAAPGTQGWVASPGKHKAPATLSPCSLPAVQGLLAWAAAADMACTFYVSNSPQSGVITHWRQFRHHVRT